MPLVGSLPLGACGRRKDVPDRAQRDLDQRIQELLERTLVTSFGETVLVARSRQDDRPEIDRVYELPVVDRFERVLCVMGPPQFEREREKESVSRKRDRERDALPLILP